MKTTVEKKFSRGGVFLRNMRLGMDLSQAAFAKKAGVHVQFVSNWERGLCAPPPKALKKLFKDRPKQERGEYVSEVADDAYAEVFAYFLKIGF